MNCITYGTKSQDEHNSVNTAELITRTPVAILAGMTAIVPVRSIGPLNINTLKSVDVLANPTLVAENPSLHIFESTHTGLKRRKNCLILIPITNLGPESITFAKQTMIAFVTKTKWRIIKNKSRFKEYFLKPKVTMIAKNLQQKVVNNVTAKLTKDGDKSEPQSEPLLPVKNKDIDDQETPHESPP